MKYTILIPRNSPDWYPGRLINHTAPYDTVEEAQVAADDLNLSRFQRGAKGRFVIASVTPTDNSDFFKEFV